MLNPTEQVIFATILGVMIVGGSLAYILVAWVTYQDRKLRQNIASVFLLNLLAIDLCNLLLVMPFSLSAIRGRWYLGNTWKMLNAFLGTTFEIGSVLAIAMISSDRLIAVMKPFIYRANMTKTKAVYAVMFTWCQAVIFAVPPISLQWYIFNRRYMSCTFKSIHGTTSFYIYMVLFLVCNFLVSLSISFATYIYIFCVTRSHRRRIAVAIIPRIIIDVQQTVTLERYRLREGRTAWKILIVMGAFLMCHLPYASMRVLELSGSSINNISTYCTVTAKWMSFSKSSLDPFIYFLLQKKFRKSFINLIRQFILSKRDRQNRKVKSIRCNVPMKKGDNKVSA